MPTIFTFLRMNIGTLTIGCSVIVALQKACMKLCTGQAGMLSGAVFAYRASSLNLSPDMNSNHNNRYFSALVYKSTQECYTGWENLAGE